MTQLVDPSEIEKIVGVRRHPTAHYVRIHSATQTVYILHSRLCLEYNPDLRDCYFSLALDRGLDERDWGRFPDRPVVADLSQDRLVPSYEGGWGPQ